MMEVSMKNSFDIKPLLVEFVTSSNRIIENERIERIVSSQEDASLRSPSVESHYYRFFYRLCQEIKPKLVLELGTHTGISSMCFALGNPGGKVVTVNNKPELRDDCRCDNVEYLYQDSLSNIPLVRAIDILFIDTDHDGKRCSEEFNLFAPRIRPGGLIFFDDIFLFECMRNFWVNFNPSGYIKFELPIHGDAGMGVLIKEAQEA